ncbi:MAG TPA: magnesium/cobalt transporter CorA [Dongiaceae bacterium]|nr:magnesium/cobalt transporter CorA [Dongiaceae bacterium]
MVLSKFRSQTAKQIPLDDAIEALIDPNDPAHDAAGADARQLGEDRELQTPPVWIDLISPTPEEIASVEQSLSLEIPTRAEMEEIELSSRLYEENGVLFMTAPVLHGAATDMPATTAVTFILTRNALVTLRYANPLPLQAFARRAERLPQLIHSPEIVLLGLLEQIVDRLADIMEATTLNLESVSRSIFHKGKRKGASDDFEAMLRQLGHAGDLSTKAKESLLGLNRLLLFLSIQSRLKKDGKTRLKSLVRDIASITEHSNFIANKVTFLLDATLGLINIEQNNIVKIFTVASVAFLPPTLIASIYGMNFHVLPELNWEFGYPFAILLMILSAVLPFWYFRRRGWL